MSLTIFLSYHPSHHFENERFLVKLSVWQTTLQISLYSHHNMKCTLFIHDTGRKNLYTLWKAMDWPHWFRYMLEKWKWNSLSRVRFFATPWTVAQQAPLSMEFSRQEYWTGLPFLSPGDFLNPRIVPGSPALQADSLPTEPPGKPLDTCLWVAYHERDCCVLSCTVGAKSR